MSAIAASILALLAFMLAFTSGIVSDRYDARKALVREEANVIGTAFLRTDFLPEPDRTRAVGLFRVSERLEAVQTSAPERMQKALVDSKRMQRELWEMAVRNANRDPQSEVAALYAASLNDVLDVHALRVAIGLQARVPDAIWLALYTLVSLGMVGVGYQTAIAGSRRSWPMLLILVVSFSVVVSLIASLDRAQSPIIAVSQQPLIDLRTSMDPDELAEDPAGQVGEGPASVE